MATEVKILSCSTSQELFCKCMLLFYSIFSLPLRLFSFFFFCHLCSDLLYIWFLLRFSQHSLNDCSVGEVLLVCRNFVSPAPNSETRALRYQKVATVTDELSFCHSHASTQPWHSHFRLPKCAILNSRKSSLPIQIKCFHSFHRWWPFDQHAHV